MARNAVLLIALAAVFALAVTSAEAAVSSDVVSHGAIRNGARELKQAPASDDDAAAPVDDDGADDGADDSGVPAPAVDDDGADDGADETIGAPIVSDDDSQGASMQATSFAPVAVLAGVGSLLIAALAA